MDQHLQQGEGDIMSERSFVVLEEFEIDTDDNGVEWLRMVEVIREESGAMHSQELIEEIPLCEFLASGRSLPSGVWRGEA